MDGTQAWASDYLPASFCKNMFGTIMLKAVCYRAYVRPPNLMMHSIKSSIFEW